MFKFKVYKEKVEKGMYWIDLCDRYYSDTTFDVSSFLFREGNEYIGPDDQFLKDCEAVFIELVETPFDDLGIHDEPTHGDLIYALFNKKIDKEFWKQFNHGDLVVVHSMMFTKGDSIEMTTSVIDHD
jgi:hypothetical protein